MTQVVEKTISPDKVTDMYDKVRQQVEKDVLRTIIVDDNECKGVAIELRDELLTMQKKLLYRFVLNGKEHIKSEIYPKETVYTEAEIANKLFAYFKEALAYELLKDSIKTFVK